MSPTTARLYVDHNVSLHLVPTLRSHGHDIVTARDLQGSRHTDDVHLLTAAHDGRVLITHDREDFTLLHDLWIGLPTTFETAVPPHSGVIVLDLAPKEVLLSMLDTFLAVVSPRAFFGQLFWWNRLTGWRRRVAGHRWENVEAARNL